MASRTAAATAAAAAAAEAATAALATVPGYAGHRPRHLGEYLEGKTGVRSERFPSEAPPAKPLMAYAPSTTAGEQYAAARPEHYGRQQQTQATKATREASAPAAAAPRAASEALETESRAAFVDKGEAARAMHAELQRARSRNKGASAPAIAGAASVGGAAEWRTELRGGAESKHSEAKDASEPRPAPGYAGAKFRSPLNAEKFHLSDRSVNTDKYFVLNYRLNPAGYTGHCPAALRDGALWRERCPQSKELHEWLAFSKAPF
jgi:hypothetical protein